MAKPKARTLQESMGFKDEDLSTPAHDAMVLWLIKNKSWVGAFLDGGPKFKPLYETSRSTVAGPAVQHDIPWDSIAHPQLNKELEGWIDVDPWAKTEIPVKSGNFVVGFIDLLLSTKRIDFQVNKETGQVEPYFRGEYVDGDAPFAHYWAIEVKPRIRSFGETMRQIRHYQEYMKTRYAIFTLDERFKADFEEQKVRCFSHKDVADFATRRLHPSDQKAIGEAARFEFRESWGN